jgi:hypothetical protein
MAIDQIESTITSYADVKEAAKVFKNMYPYAGKIYIPRRALEVLRDMLECQNRAETYFLNNYHYLLLYDVLEWLCDFHNDQIAGAKGKSKRNLSKIGEFYIREIDFDSIISVYFFDTDFLMNQELMLRLGTDGRQYLGMNDETFSITTGLSPHPEELGLKIYTGDDATRVSEESDLFGPKSRRYPDWSYYNKIHKS